MKHSEGELIWHGDYPPAIVERVRSDIAENLDGALGIASDLCFHTVFLGEDDDMENGPIVTVWGEEGSSAIHCEYVEKPEWVKLSDLEDSGN